MSEEKFVLNAEVRTAVGGGSARRVRKQDKVPGIVYNTKTECTPISISAVGARALFNHHGLMTLVVDGVEKQVIVKEIQKNFILDKASHVDFSEVDMNREVHAIIPVIPTGTPDAIGKGGQLEQPMHELEVVCLPSEMPESIIVDISEMAMDSTMLVRDLTLPENIRVIQSEKSCVFQINSPKIEEESTEEEE